ncbi:MAG: hypothetical protein EXS14_03840 [Planctomycetes bacterium]|nr:hypothetical protein [Planctomycetota bacterium]
MRYPIWGIDVTAVALRGVRIVMESDGVPRIVAWDALDFTTDVEHIGSSARVAPMARAIRQFASGKQLRNSRVWVSLRGETGFNRTVVLPEATDRTLPAVLLREAEQNIPYPLSEVYWDQRLSDLSADSHVEATFYAVRRQIVDDRIKKFAQSGLPADGIQLRPLALLNFCAWERLLEDGTLILDFDYAGVHVLLHHEGRSWFRVVPAGGADYVAALRERFNINHTEAVDLAAGHGRCPDPAAMEDVKRRMQGMLLDEAERVIRFYTSARPGCRIRKVVLFESHRCVPSMETMIARRLEVPVVAPRGFKHVRVDPQVVGPGLQENFGAFARATGLALQGADVAAVKVQLFPAGMRRDLGVRLRWWIAAVVLACIGLVLASERQADSAATLSAKADALRLPPAGARQQDAELRAIDVEAPLRRMAALAATVNERDLPRRILEVVMAKAGVGGVHVAALEATDGPTARLVLASIGAADPATTARLDAFAADLIRAGSVVRAQLPGATWVSAHLCARPPIAQAVGVIRVPVVHRSYTLEIRGGAP